MAINTRLLYSKHPRSTPSASSLYTPVRAAAAHQQSRALRSGWDTQQLAPCYTHLSLPNCLEDNSSAEIGSGLPTHTAGSLGSTPPHCVFPASPPGPAASSGALTPNCCPSCLSGSLTAQSGDGPPRVEWATDLQGSRGEGEAQRILASLIQNNEQTVQEERDPQGGQLPMTGQEQEGGSPPALWCRLSHHL